MRAYRGQQLANVLQQEMSTIFLREFNFENALVTITHVDVNSNISEATVTLSVIPFEKELKIITMIEKRKGWIAWKLLKRMHIRAIPQLHFRIQKL